MSLASYVVYFAGLALEVCLLWRLLRKGLWREYPYFYVCVIFVLIRTVSLFTIL